MQGKRHKNACSCMQVRREGERQREGESHPLQSLTQIAALVACNFDARAYCSCQTIVLPFFYTSVKKFAAVVWGSRQLYHKQSKTVVFLMHSGWFWDSKLLLQFNEKCIKMHHFRFKISKFSRGWHPRTPLTGGGRGRPPPGPTPRTTSGASRLWPSGGRCAADCWDPNPSNHQIPPHPWGAWIRHRSLINHCRQSSSLR